MGECNFSIHYPICYGRSQFTHTWGHVSSIVQHVRKIEFGGIQTHTQKTVALTQHHGPRPLGHQVALENSGIELETSCMLSTRSTN